MQLLWYVMMISSIKKILFNFLRNSIHKHPRGVSTMCENVIYGFRSFGFVKSLMKGLKHLDIPNQCQRIDDDVIQEYVKHNNIPIFTVSYNNQSDEHDENFASCNMYSHQNHPNWDELRNDNRTDIRKKCIPLLKKALRK